MKTTRIRWWPGIVIAVAVAIALAWVWLREAPMIQNKVLSSYPILGVGIVALALWLTLASGLGSKVRAGIALSFVCTAILGGALVEIKGVDGNIIPVFGFRWRTDPGFREPGIAPTNTRAVSAHSAANPGSEVPTAEPALQALPTGADGNDFPQFYGPNRSATLAGPRLATDWHASPPKEMWRISVGEA